ncbi:NAD(P)H-binding protein [Micromonospora luteifusca]|uniref:NAD(P)H-binding protein n=1 Tax=Micromonospora luteifusca TaxID=709860 RepID=UPI0033A5744F
MTNEQERNTILVLGGTGKTGRRVVERLREAGEPVRVGSRSAEQPFDWTDRTTWAPVLRNVNAVYVSFYPDLAVPGAPETVGAFANLAVASGVARLVLLSGRGEEEAQAAEKLIQSAGAEWTILRSSWFSQNFSEDYLREPVVGGEVVLPVGTVPEPFVDADDIAEVAVAALTGGGHAGQLYELTGPRLLTFADAIGEIAQATGRRIDFVPVAVEEYAGAMAAEGVPAEVVELLTYLFTTVLDGRNAQVADGVQRALGRPPRDFTDFARDTAATGVWDRT